MGFVDKTGESVMKRSTVSFCVLCVLVFGVVLLGSCVNASAAEIVESGSCGTNVTYTLDGDGLLTISGTGKIGNYPPFSRNQSVKKVIIANGVTSIGYSAFENCTGLTNVTIPDSVTSISEYAFYGCTDLQSVTIPDSVTSIGYFVFSGCSGLTNVIISDSVTSIGNYAFSGCSGLANVTIPDSVTSIGNCAFSGCTNLKNVTIPSSVTLIEGGAFFSCTGLTSVTIPDDVMFIDSETFSGCSGLANVTIPDSVTSIGNYAFFGCTGLTNVTIPDSVASIGDYAFSGCTGLKSATIFGGEKSISDSAFQNCQPVILGDADSFALRFAVDNNYIFAKNTPCSLVHTWDNGKVTSQATGHSKGTKLYTCKVCGETKTEYFFKDEYLIASGDAEQSKWYLDKDGVLTITGTGVTVPDSFRVGDFNDPGEWYDIVDDVKSVVVTGEYDYLGDSVFDQFNNLESVEISRVKKLNDNAFGYSKNLKNASIGSDVYIIDSNAFSGCEKLETVSIGSDVYVIGSNAFDWCSNLDSVLFGPDVYVIGSNAFYECENLQTVTIESSAVIGSGSFLQCYSLKTVSLGKNVRMIEESAFSGCENLQTVTIESCAVISSESFSQCTGLKTVSLGKNVRMIEEAAFSGCRNLQSVDFASGDISVADKVFTSCGNRSVPVIITIPAGKTVIGKDVFYGACAEVHFLGDFPELKGELNTYGWGKVICFYPCGNETWNTRLPRTVEWRVEHTGEWTSLNDKQHRRVCTKDASHIETEDHSWDDGEVTTAATCTDDGIKTYICGVCGATKTETVATIGHAYGEWTGLDDSQHQRICANDPNHKETEDHVWDNGTVETVAACTVEGKITYTCTVCGAERTEMIPATGHAYGAWTPLNDTQHQRVCANDASHIETADHQWNDGEITKQPTEEAEGEKTFTCIVCGATRTEPIPKLEPESSDDEYMPGDVDGNGQVLANDARLALRASAKLETLDEKQKKAADVDGSGEVLANDARQILRFSAKLQHSFEKT